jgi:hypothetical protein
LCITGRERIASVTASAFGLHAAQTVIALREGVFSQTDINQTYH